MVTHFNKAATNTTTEACRKRKTCVTPETRALCDQRRGLKNKRRDKPEGAKDYREINRKNQDRYEDGKRDLDRGSMPVSGSMPQKE